MGRNLMRKQATLAAVTEQSERPIGRIVAAPPGDSSSTVLTLIERLALDPRADVEKLDRMMGIYERLKAKEAELAFNAAKGRILKKLADIKFVKNKPAFYEIDKRKTQKGTYEAFTYAPLEEIDKHLRLLLLKEKMDLSYSDEPREHGWILIRGRLKHLPGGHFGDSLMPGPLDTSGGKSNVEGVGSTNSYLRRHISPAISSTSSSSATMTTETEAP
jgi:hypothetical protein